MEIIPNFLLLIASLAAVWVFAKLEIPSRTNPTIGVVTRAVIATTWGLFLLIVVGVMLKVPRVTPHLTLPLWIAIGLSLLLTLPWVNQPVMRLLHLDPKRALHHIPLYAFCGSALMLTLVLSNGISLDLTEALGDLTTVSATKFVQMGLGLLHGILLPLLAVGWLTYRSRSATLQRLGLRRIPMGALALRIPALCLASFSVSAGVAGLFLLLEKITGLNISHESPELLVPLTLPAILSVFLQVVVTAGVTEELLCRGVLQPRVGILWSSLFFAALHIQYPIDGLTDVFVGSLLLGLIARYYSLWASIGAHALHNLVSVGSPNLYAYTPKPWHVWFDAAGYTLVAAGLGFCCYFLLQWSKGRRNLEGWQPSRNLRYGLSALASVCLIVGSVVAILEG